MKTNLVKFFYAIIFLVLMPQIGYGQIKQALIINNSTYSKLADLASSETDCIKLKDALLADDYKVTLITDGTQYEMKKAIDNFYSKDSAISLFYYAGYVFNFKNGNYLVPVDVKNKFFKEGLIPFNDIGHVVKTSKSKPPVDIVMIDAFLNNKNNSVKEKQKQHFVELNNANKNSKSFVVANVKNEFIPYVEQIQDRYVRYDTISFLDIFMKELTKEEQTIRGTFRSIELSVASSYLLSDIENIPPDFLWTGKVKNKIRSILPSFPFPPPRASTNHLLESSMFDGTDNLYDLGRTLDNTLRLCGYHEKSYYSIPNGFALVTRMERIEEDASPCALPERWKTPESNSKERFSLANYIKSLIFTDEEKYRIIVFLVTDIPITPKKEEPNLKTARSWLSEGANTLSDNFCSIKYTEKYKCTAFVYEFDKKEYEKGTYVVSSDILCYYHLLNTNFFLNLKNRTK